MNAAAFPSPTAEMAEMNRIQYELDYTEGISQRMRIPEMLKVAPQAHHHESNFGSQEVPHSVIMQVPERIVISGDSNDPQYPRPRDLDLIQSTPLESLSLKTPPRVLTLSDRPLDFMEEEQQQQQQQQQQRAAPESEEVPRTQGRLRRERSASENAAARQSTLIHNDSSVTASPPAAIHPCPPLTITEEEQTLYSASGVLSFLQSTTRRAYQQVLEVLDENPRSKQASLRGGSASSSNPLQESRLALSTYEPSMDGSDDMTVVDATTLRRQLIKLNRRLQHLEEENKERTKREMILYSVTVAFWLVNTWVWLRR